MSGEDSDDPWLAQVMARQKELPESPDERDARERAEYREAEKAIYPYLYEDNTPTDDDPKGMLLAARRWRKEVKHRWPDQSPTGREGLQMARALGAWRKRYGLRSEDVEIALNEYFRPETDPTRSAGWLVASSSVRSDVDPWRAEAFIQFLKTNHGRFRHQRAGAYDEYREQLNRDYWERGIGYMGRGSPS